MTQAQSRTTSTHYRAPHRPALIRLLNAAGSGVGWRSSLGARALMDAAKKRERLESFGEPAVEEPLSRLVESIEAEADLNPVGRFLTRERLIGVLRNRLRLADHLERHPQLRAQPPGPWLVITGMQRTGTTFLQRLLAGDPNTRSLASWEALAPVAPRKGPDRRRQAAVQAQRALSYMAPDFFAVHPVEADGVEEDSLLLDLSLYSPVAEATLFVPGYAKWLDGQDMTAAYTLLRDALAVLEPSRRWVLKSPAHLPFLDVLKKTGRDVRLVMTHRDPIETLGSYCSMIAHGRGVFSDAIDPHAIGQEYLEKQSFMVHKALELRAADPGLPVLDVTYRDITKTPEAVVEKVYAFAGWDFDEQARKGVAAVMASHTQHRFGKHRYELSDFGLTPEKVQAQYAAYYDHLAAVGALSSGSPSANDAHTP